MRLPSYYYVWTSAMQDRLLALLKQGMPYKEIAKIISGETGLKITKNACIGKGRRLGVPLRLPARKRLPCRKRNAPASYARKRLPLAAARSRPRPPKGKAKSPIRKLQPPLRNLSLLQLRTSSCRYPTVHSPPFKFCGAHQQDGSSYCPEHHALCHYKGRALL